MAAVRSTAPAEAEARPGGTAKAACRGALLARPRPRVRASCDEHERVRDARTARRGDNTLSGVSSAAVARGLRGDGANSR